MGLTPEIIAKIEESIERLAYFHRQLSKAWSRIKATKAGRLLMPGGQGVTYPALFGGVEVHVSLQRASKWRFLPFFGNLFIFKLGNLVKFKLVFTLLRKEVIDELERSFTSHNGKGNVQLGLIINGKDYHWQDVEFVIPQEGRDTCAVTKEYFLEQTGGAHLRLGRAMGTTIYTFEVWEPALSLVNWMVAISAGLLGGSVSGLLVWLLTRGSNGQ